MDPGQLYGTAEADLVTVLAIDGVVDEAIIDRMAQRFDLLLVDWASGRAK